jgi:hypothetical protein
MKAAAIVAATASNAPQREFLETALERETGERTLDADAVRASRRPHSGLPPMSNQGVDLRCMPKL